MYGSGYSSGGTLLGGLSSKPSVAAFGKGRGMASAAGIGMEKQKADQEMNVNQMQEDSRQRMQHAGNMASRAGNETQENIQAGSLGSRMANFHTGLAWEQQNANRRRALDFRQSLFNSLTQDF